MTSILCIGFATADACGTVICAEAVTSLGLLSFVFASLMDKSSLGTFGSFGVGVKRSGWAVCASRVSKGKRDACGRPVVFC